MNKKYMINIRGKKFYIDIEKKVLVCVDNPRLIRDISEQYEYEHFKKIVKSY